MKAEEVRSALWAKYNDRRRYAIAEEVGLTTGFSHRHLDVMVIDCYNSNGFRTDKNGKRIFEGDICLCDRNIAPSVDAQTFQILFDVDAGQWVGSGPNSDIDSSQFCMCEVVKTVHDNPELLEGGTDNE